MLSDLLSSLTGIGADIAPDGHYDRSGEVTYDDAFDTFIEGGGHLGMGAAALVAGAYTGIALTPSLVLDSLEFGGASIGIAEDGDLIG